MTRPRWELCRSDAGWWVRFRSSNGKIIVSSETYDRKRDALRAIALVREAYVLSSPFGMGTITNHPMPRVIDKTAKP